MVGGIGVSLKGESCIIIGLLLFAPFFAGEPAPAGAEFGTTEAAVAVEFIATL